MIISCPCLVSLLPASVNLHITMSVFNISLHFVSALQMSLMPAVSHSSHKMHFWMTFGSFYLYTFNTIVIWTEHFTQKCKNLVIISSSSCWWKVSFVAHRMFVELCNILPHNRWGMYDRCWWGLLLLVKNKQKKYNTC